MEGDYLARLSPRQRQVLALVSRHLTSKEIAKELGLSPRTVDRHVEEINERLGVSSRSEAARLFQRSAADGEQLPMVTAAVAEVTLPDQTLSTPEHSDAARVDRLGDPDRGLAWLLKAIFSMPPVGGKRHNLDLGQRLILMGRIALISIILATASLVIVAGALDYLSRN